MLKVIISNYIDESLKISIIKLVTQKKLNKDFEPIGSIRTKLTWITGQNGSNQFNPILFER